jgi:hypothetical protein
MCRSPWRLEIPHKNWSSLSGGFKKFYGVNWLAVYVCLKTIISDKGGKGQVEIEEDIHPSIHQVQSSACLLQVSE